MSKRLRLLSAATAFAGVLACGAAWAGDAGHYQAEIQAALAGGKPVLVDFYADW